MFQPASSLYIDETGQFQNDLQVGSLYIVEYHQHSRVCPAAKRPGNAGYDLWAHFARLHGRTPGRPAESFSGSGKNLLRSLRVNQTCDHVPDSGDCGIH